MEFARLPGSRWRRPDGAKKSLRNCGLGDHPYHHPEYGTATYKGEPEEVNLHATLRKATFPPGVSVALVLRQVQGRVEGVETFLANAEKYENSGFVSTVAE